VTGEAPLLIRADATGSMGTGHAMRCLSLAQAWQDAGGSCIFAAAELTPSVRQRIEAENCDVVLLDTDAGGPSDARQFAELAHTKSSRFVVVDGYQFGADYQRGLKAAGLRTLFIDDYGHAEYYRADLVLNQNISAAKELYEHREPESRLLLGPRYALLRREFQAWRAHKREIPSVARKVLITLGGSDPEKLTKVALEAVASIKLDDLDTVVVMGGSNPDYGSVKQLGFELAAQHGVKITVQRDIANMAELMAGADVAISAAGTTCWELCLLGLPALLIDVADNQTGVAQELHRLQCAVHVGSAKEVSVLQLSAELEKLLRSKELRQTLSTRARELVDGKGARRVAAVLRGDNVVHLRPANENDSRLLFEWANDAEVRAGAFSPESIPWERHEQWFADKMKNPNCLIQIAEDEHAQPLGQFRVDWLSSGDGEIDVSVAREYRGEKYGRKIIRLGVEAAFAQRETGTRLHALVKLENKASARAFASAGFTNLGEKDVNGNRAVHFVVVKE
jgi:UDP-2,4-diacetamido-2,4,6-trideoxy-beta-L-altropyranose hydrolase